MIPFILSSSITAGFGAKGLANGTILNINNLNEDRGISYAAGGVSDRVRRKDICDINRVDRELDIFYFFATFYLRILEQLHSPICLATTFRTWARL